MPPHNAARSQAPQMAIVPQYELPEIRVNNRQLRDVSQDCLQAIARSNVPPYLFARGGELVYVVADEYGRAKIAPVSATFLCGQLTRTADFFRTSDNGRTRVNPPMPAVFDLLSRPVAELGLPPLVALSETPLLRPDGSVVDMPGYDNLTRTIYAPSSGLSISPIPKRPSKRDLQGAINFIEEGIGEFPWVDEASRANAFAMLLTPVLRPAITGCVPIALCDAPQAGSGKSLLIEVLSLIHTGTAAAMKPAPEKNEEEWRKTLTAAIYNGNQLTIFDNVDETLKSPALAMAVTAEIWTDRILGRTATITIPQRTVFVVTGNNISLGGDILRRCYWIRLDAKMPRPWQGRKFRHPRLKEWVRQNRAKFLNALLTLASAWYAAGRPKANTPILGSYEEWSEITGGILAFAGIEGFLGNLTDLYQNGDPSEAQWVALLVAIRSAFGDGAFKVKRLLTKEIMGVGPISDAIPDELEQPWSKGNSRVIGRAFLRRLHRRMGDEGLYLEQDGEAGGVALWRVKAD